MFVSLKNEHKSPLLCILCSNVVTHFELSNDGKLSKKFSPLKFFKLTGSKSETVLIQLDHREFAIKNISEIMCWIQDLMSGARIKTELFV